MTIAMVGQKTFHWQLNKAIPSGTYNCNFEAINSVVNERIKKVEMKYELFIYTVIYLMLWTIFRKKLVMLVRVKSLLRSLHKKWSFPFRVSAVNVTKSAVFCKLGHIYWRNSNWKTSFFVQWFDRDFHSYRSFWVQLQFEISIQQFLFIAESCF